MSIAEYKGVWHNSYTKIINHSYVQERLTGKCLPTSATEIKSSWEKRMSFWEMYFFFQFYTEVILFLWWAIITLLFLDKKKETMNLEKESIFKIWILYMSKGTKHQGMCKIHG